MRDVYLRLTSAASSSSASITVHKTREHARAGTTAIGSVTFSLGISDSLAIVNVSANAPDVTGMTVTVASADATDEEIAAVWGYTASPDLDLCEDYAELLAEYTGDGAALARYANAIQSYTVGAHHPKAFLYVKPESIETVTNSIETRELRGRKYVLRAQIMLAGLGRGNKAGTIELLENQLRDDLAAVESIVLDERRTMDGDRHRCAKVEWVGVEMPTPAAGEYKAYMVAALLFGTTIHGHRSDYTGD